tara:strand:- start:1693 stop:2451 length:759 start_codon:yes stop_codon:yes gene_type:complete
MTESVAPSSFKKWQKYIAFDAANAPANTNQYSIEIAAPGGMTSFNDVKKSTTVQSIDFYANNVTLPSRAVTTGEINNIGQIRRFATGQTNSEINVQFLVQKDQRHREFFEHWLHMTASDSDNTVAFYNDYVIDMVIRKWEYGPKGNDRDGDANYINSAVFKLYGAYPFNLGQIQLDNEQNGLMYMDVSFYFERYRMDVVDKGMNLRDARKMNLRKDLQQAEKDESINEIIRQFRRFYSKPQFGTFNFNQGLA